MSVQGKLWLASVYCKQERFEEAEPLLKEILALQEKVDSSANSKGSANEHLAKLYASQKKFAQAEPVFERAVEFYEKSGDSYQLSKTLEAYGEVLRKVDKVAAAEKVEARAKSVSTSKRTIINSDNRIFTSF
ncbi:MAG: tetratricopeptide repeat protein [Cyanobacteria bacterium]|nr:tetratricopeptide repeat protein [Cyanobacteriota bacterium]